MNKGVHLLTYADRLGGTIAATRELLAGPLAEFSGVHLLPFFTPFDGDDAGFDPVDHTAVDPRLGEWGDVRALAAEGKVVTADLIVNHMSADSRQFRDWLARGACSEHEGLFLTFDRVFPHGADEAAITSFYRPRPGLPFTPFAMADGSRRLVWTTFMPSQVDIDVTHPAGMAYLGDVVATLAAGGVRIVRIDAVGYAIKTPGTDSFMTAETLAFVEVLAAMCRDHGLEVLVEVHAHYTQQQRIAPLVDLVYDFATPALLLHSFVTGTVERLVHWIGIRPENTLTVLDTHDGIGIIDAGPTGVAPGLINEDEMAAIFAWADEQTAGVSGQASVVPAWCTMPHQINSTFFDVLGHDPGRYLLARAVQLFLPGTPQIYYVGLLAGENDVAAWRATGQGREVNRHRYTADELAEALERPVVRALLGLVALRSAHPAFDGGAFSARMLGEERLELCWRADDGTLRLVVDVVRASLELWVDGAANPLRTMDELSGLGSWAATGADGLA